MDSPAWSARRQAVAEIERVVVQGARSGEEAARMALQTVLGVIESRQFRAPASYAKDCRISDSTLDQLAAELREHDANSNAPIKLVTGSFEKAIENWCLGRYTRDGEDAEAWITTDRVHASEMRGDALCDAEAWVCLRNNLALIIGALEELLALRLALREGAPKQMPEEGAR